MVNSSIPYSVESIQPLELNWINELLFQVSTLELLKLFSQVYLMISQRLVILPVLVVPSV